MSPSIFVSLPFCFTFIQVLDDKKSSAIDGIINMDKSKLSQEELKNLFSEKIAQENILQVGVPLPHRPKQDQPGNNPLKNTVVSTVYI